MPMHGIHRGDKRGVGGILNEEGGEDTEIGGVAGGDKGDDDGKPFVGGYEIRGSGERETEDIPEIRI